MPSDVGVRSSKAMNLNHKSNDEPDAPRRSSDSLEKRRITNPWPDGRDFKVLSIDGGGIRGIFPATFLASIEDRFLGGASVTKFFDLITGTSTGGIIALGLSIGMKAAELRDLYISRGSEIFPPIRDNAFGRVKILGRYLRNIVKFRYDRKSLNTVLEDTFRGHRFGDAHSRLCIPSFDGRYGETYVFKTPHHPDYWKDWKEPMLKVATATSAAPVFFQPYESDGYIMIDGGVWANNPIMIGLVEALSCFNVTRDRIHILSLGCSDQPYIVSKAEQNLGGLGAWRKIFYASLWLQSQCAIGQARLLIGADQIARINTPKTIKKISLDDWTRAVDILPEHADIAVDKHGDSIAHTFLKEPVDAYQPIYS